MDSPAPTRNPRGQGERLRGALLDAAAELLSEDPDVTHLSVRAVTGRAGVTHTAMYLHFADKQALIEAVKAQTFADLTDLLDDAVRAAGTDPVAGLHAAGLAYLRFAAARPGHYAVMFHGGRPQATATPDGVRAAGLRAFQRMVALAGEVVGADDAHDAATNLWLALHGRVGVRRSLPWFPMVDDATYVRDQVEALGHRRSRP